MAGKWFIANRGADFAAWTERFHISEMTARVLRNRDLKNEDEVDRYLNGTLADCYSPWLLPDMDRAVEAILGAVSAGKRIRVIGDYDVDGICASYILTDGLTRLGADADAAIPHRILDGYGLNPHLIREAAEQGAEFLITCDNGVAEGESIALAKSLGIDTVVTDHHEVPFKTEGERRIEQLPPAKAVVDPMRDSCGYPFRHICGAVVAYKVVQALAERSGLAELTDALEEYLELTALATVCDVMELRDENRILVREGLRRMKNSRNPGLAALIRVNEVDPDELSAYHLGFVLGPCLNASGRLDTAARSLRLLQSRTEREAMTLAGELKDLNDSRKAMTKRGVEDAVRYIEEHRMDADKVLVVYLPEVHESLAGIIAGRIRERYHHPAIVLTKSEEGVKGSGRSIEAYHLYHGLTEVAHLFTKFGGHSQAAGLSMDSEEKVECLRRELNENCKLAPEEFEPVIHLDLEMSLDYPTLEMAGELERLEPFGKGNGKPLFGQRQVRFTGGVRMGPNKSFARFTVRTPAGNVQRVQYFGDTEEFDRFLEERFGEGSAERLYAGEGDFPVTIAYQLRTNCYQGQTRLQFVMQYFK